jgi:hypothetical protein
VHDPHQWQCNYHSTNVNEDRTWIESFAKVDTKKWTCPQNKTKQNKTIIFIFTMQTYKVKDLIVFHSNGIKIKHNKQIIGEKKHRMRDSDYLFISKLRQIEIIRKVFKYIYILWRNCLDVYIQSLVFCDICPWPCKENWIWLLNWEFHAMPTKL